MYWSMNCGSNDLVIDRGMALHKMIRLITMTLGGDGYLTFMGNEFGHPEWIDFPREGNGWSYHYCRRQWSLAENKDLKYRYLNAFEQAAVKLCKQGKVLESTDRQLFLDNDRKIVVYQKGNLILAFNFHPNQSYDGCFLPMPEDGKYDVVMSTDDFCFGGFGRIYHQRYETENNGIRMYLPSRTAAVIQKIEN